MLTKLKYKLWKHLNKQFTNNKVEQNLEFLNNIVQNINNTTINAVDTAKQLMIGVNVDIVEKLLKINEVNVAIPVSLVKIPGVPRIFNVARMVCKIQQTIDFVFGIHADQ